MTTDNPAEDWTDSLAEDPADTQAGGSADNLGEDPDSPVENCRQPNIRQNYKELC